MYIPSQVLERCAEDSRGGSGGNNNGHNNHVLYTNKSCSRIPYNERRSDASSVEELKVNNEAEGTQNRCHMSAPGTW